MSVKLIVDGVSMEIAERYFDESLGSFVRSCRSHIIEVKVTRLLTTKYGDKIALSMVPMIVDLPENNVYNWVNAELGLLVRKMRKNPSGYNVPIELVVEMLMSNQNKLDEVLASDEYRKLS